MASGGSVRAGRNEAVAGSQIASAGTVQLTPSGRTSFHCSEPGNCCSTASETVCPGASGGAVEGTTRKPAGSAAARTSTCAVAMLFK